MRNLHGGFVTAWLVAGLCGGFGDAVVAGTQPRGDALYRCTDRPEVRRSLGVLFCTSEPTDTLQARSEPDNLQARAGALVSDVDTASTAARAGLQVGDMVYRVGGVDVDDAEAAARQFGTIGTTADTVVNFLRGGRPYRIKLRR